MSTGIDDGGPAFPAPDKAESDYGKNNRGFYSGMSLRDYFANHADLGNVDELSIEMGKTLLGRDCPSWSSGAVIECMQWWADYRSVLRYIEADAMLRARKA